MDIQQTTDIYGRMYRVGQTAAGLTWIAETRRTIRVDGTVEKIVANDDGSVALVIIRPSADSQRRQFLTDQCIGYRADQVVATRAA